MHYLIGALGLKRCRFGDKASARRVAMEAGAVVARRGCIGATTWKLRRKTGCSAEGAIRYDAQRIHCGGGGRGCVPIDNEDELKEKV